MCILGMGTVLKMIVFFIRSESHSYGPMKASRIYSIITNVIKLLIKYVRFA